MHTSKDFSKLGPEWIFLGEGDGVGGSAQELFWHNPLFKRGSLIDCDEIVRFSHLVCKYTLTASLRREWSKCRRPQRRDRHECHFKLIFQDSCVGPRSSNHFKLSFNPECWRRSSYRLHVIWELYHLRRDFLLLVFSDSFDALGIIYFIPYLPIHVVI